MTIDDQIRYEKSLYDIKREAAKYQPDYFTNLVGISYWWGRNITVSSKANNRTS